MAASVLLLGGFLCTRGLSLVQRWILEPQALQSPDADELLGAAATFAGLIVTVWWVLSMASALASAFLEVSGRKHAAATAGKFCPEFMRRLALAALTVQLASAPLAHAGSPAPGPGWMPTQEVAASAAWGPTGAAATPVHPAAPSSAATRPTGEPPQSSGPQPNWRPNAPVPAPDPVVARPLRDGPLPPQSSMPVTVLAGDTLWDIAARDLGPGATDREVALHWPRWYQANRAVIGENPDVLLPGQILDPPAADWSADTSAVQLSKGKP